MIKPSSQTPTHLKTHKLSLFDQFASPIYVPILFFYPRQEPVHHNNTILKTSLSSALTKFYPLAGTIRGEEVDCNDKGVVFLQARIDLKLVEMLEVPPSTNRFKIYRLSITCRAGKTVSVNRLGSV
ncbi:Stemmadenine O-acetyltransferase [Linum grandiflorum]